MDADVRRLRRERAAATADQHEAEGPGGPIRQMPVATAADPASAPQTRERATGWWPVRAPRPSATESAIPIPATTIARRR
jgi:hypothetical protein